MLGAARGRPPALIALDPAAGVAVGVDLGKRHPAGAGADLSHRVLAEEGGEMPEDYEAEVGMDRAAMLVETVLADSGADHDRILGVGMGLPGPVHRSGIVGSSAILPGWAGTHGAERMAERLGLEVWLGNDANLGALSEATWGAGRGANALVYLKLSTGIGAGVVIDGRLFGGAGGTAGEIGHTTLDETGDICRCGSRGCLETYAAGAAIARQLSRSRSEELDLDGVLGRAAAGDAERGRGRGGRPRRARGPRRVARRGRARAPRGRPGLERADTGADAGRDSGNKIGGVRMRKRRWRLSMLAVACILAAGVLLAACGDDDDDGGGGGGGGGDGGGGGSIALLLPESKTARYESQDRPNFQRKVQELCPDCDILYSNADQDAAKQQQQAEAAITKGAEVMVLDPVDAASAAAIVTRAKQSDVPVISYDRLITDADIDYYISFDNVRVGELQAESLSEKLEEDGKGDG